MAKIKVFSKRSGQEYYINYLSSYRIETSIDVASDGFEIVIGNPSYQVSNVVSAGDKIIFYLDDNIALEGYIDDLDLEYTLNSNDLRITGRDEVATILDNDANPKTYNQTDLKNYMGKVLPGYGIKYYCTNTTKFKKIVVSPGENEYSVIERLSKERNLKLIYNIKEGRLDATKPISTKEYSYYFNNKSDYAMKILDCQITISNDITNEVIVYGGTDKKKVKGSYKDSNLKTKKRKIINDSDIEKVADANKRAKEEFYNINKNAFTIKLTTPTKKPIYINKCARVKIDKLGLDAYLLVDSVTYSKSISSGSLTEIILKLMPGVGVKFKNNDIPLLPKL